MMADGLRVLTLGWWGFFGGFSPCGWGYPVRQMENAWTEKKGRRMRGKKDFRSTVETDRE